MNTTSTDLTLGTAFDQEALLHIDALFNFALSMTKDPDDAQDLVQETYLRAYRFSDKYEIGTNCKAWLFRILRNTFINKYRKGTKEPDRVDYDENESPNQLLSCSEDLRQSMFDKMFDDDVTGAIAALPEIFKVPVLLCDIEGFTYEEIANMVDCPVGTVRSRIHRGRKMLRERLYSYAKYRGFDVDGEMPKQLAVPAYIPAYDEDESETETDELIDEDTDVIVAVAA